MIYTTTKCPHCGYRTRNMESGVSRVELGQTLFCCPKCNTLIMDTINTEYEFMTNRERKKWATTYLITTETIRGIFLLTMGIMFLIAEIISGVSEWGFGIIFALLFGGGLIVWSIEKFISIGKAKTLHIGEQLIYESLLRTSNKKYVELLQSGYGKKRTYSPLLNRSKTIDAYKKYSIQDIHKRFNDEFSNLLNMIENEDEKTEIEKAKTSSSCINGGALASGVMAVSSTVVEAKQNKELENRLTNEKINDEQKVIEKVQTKNLEAIESQQNKTTKVKPLESVNKNKLLELKELFDEGLITEEEYGEKRRKILEDI